MKKERIWGILGLLLFGLVFAGCPDATSTLSSDARVAKVNVAGIDALTLGTPSMEWTEAAENPGHVFVPNQSLAGASVEVSTVDSSATVFMARAISNVLPDFSGTKVLDFEGEDFLYIEVFSANLDAYLIYAIQVHNRNPGIKDLTLDGRSAEGGKTLAGATIPSFGSIGVPGSSWDAIEQEGEIVYGDNQEGDSLAVTITPEVDSSSVRVVTTSGGAPNFTGAFLNPSEGIVEGINVTAVDGNFIFIEVKGAGTFYETMYYKLKMVQKKSDRGLKSAKFVYYNGNEKLGEYPLSIGTMGTHSWSGGENYGNYDNGAEVAGAAGDNQSVNVNSPGIFSKYLDDEGRPPANFRIVLEVEGNDPELKKSFAINKNQRASLEFDNTTGDFGNLLGFWWWGVEVESGTGEKGWYKFASRIGSESTALGSVKINGVTLDISDLEGNITAADKSQGFIQYTLPAGDSFSSVKVEVAPPAGYQSQIGVSASPTETTDISPITFDINYEASYDTATHLNTTTLTLEPGQFIVIRVLAEISWYYGGSGFTGATWQPARTGAYTAWKYYKIQVVRGATDTGLTSIKYKGTEIPTLPTPSTIDWSTSTSYGTDNKKNIITSTTVTSAWYEGAALDYETADYSNVVIEAVPAYPNLKIGYAVAASDNPLAEADFSSSGQLTFVESNNYVVIRVASEDGTNVLYYRLHLVSPLGSDYVPTAVSVNGVAITGAAIGAGNTAANGATMMSNIELPNKEAFNQITVTVTKPNDGVDVAYALDAANNTNISDWTNTSGVFVDVPVAQYLYIRTRSADRTQTRYFKTRLLIQDARSDVALTGLTIRGASVTPPEGNNLVTGTTSGLYRVPGDSITVLSGLEVNATASPGASVAYAMVAANNEGPSDWSNTTGLFPTWQNAQYLVIRVAAEDGYNFRYYKVRIVWGDDDAELTDIKINGTSITGETTVLPVPNTIVTGTTSVVYHVASASDLTNLQVAVTAPETASVAYAMAAANNTNTTDWTNLTGSFPSFTAAQYLVIRVVSQDTMTTNFYKVRLAVGNSSTEITGITVNGVDIGAIPASNAAVTGTNAGTYAADNVLSPVTVAVTQAAGNSATVTYAVAATASANTAAANFTAANNLVIPSGQYAVIRVVSQDTLNTAYYKVQVIHGNPDADLLGVTINDVYVVPTPDANDVVTGTNTGTSEVAAASLASVKVKVGVSPGASIAYGVADAVNVGPANFNNTTGVFLNFTADEFIVVRVISQDGQTTRYYKIQVKVTP